MHKHLVWMGFTVDCWIGSAEGEEHFFMTLTSLCHHVGCGGRVHFTVCAGKIKEERYLAKKPDSLKSDEKFPLPEQICCTNCAEFIVVDSRFADAISRMAEDSLKALKEIRVQARKAASAPWN